MGVGEKEPFKNVRLSGKLLLFKAVVIFGPVLRDLLCFDA